MNDYEIVFNGFVNYRRSINRSIPTLTDSKKKKICKALEIAKKEHLILLFDYLSNSKDEYTTFINGKNDNNRFYGTMDNLFRKSKLKEKINRAKKWEEKQKNIIKNRAQDLYIPFMIVEQEDYNLLIEEFGDDFETIEEKEENNIGIHNFHMFIHASKSKNKDSK